MKGERKMYRLYNKDEKKLVSKKYFKSVIEAFDYALKHNCEVVKEYYRIYEEYKNDESHYERGKYFIKTLKEAQKEFTGAIKSAKRENTIEARSRRRTFSSVLVLEKIVVSYNDNAEIIESSIIDSRTVTAEKW